MLLDPGARTPDCHLHPEAFPVRNEAGNASQNPGGQGARFKKIYLHILPSNSYFLNRVPEGQGG